MVTFDAVCPICNVSKDKLDVRPERLRDSDSLSVLNCRSCDHTFLSDFNHVDEEYFVNDTFLLSKPDVTGVEQRLRHFEAENKERVERIGPLVVNKRVLEFGCGAGALMGKLMPLCDSIEGIERTASFRTRLHEDGYLVHEDINQTQGEFDVILMFHVLEHLADPVQAIRACMDRIKPNGLLYIEVPNVNDALLSLYDVESYHKFHFFKDHLHYFSRRSLEKCLEKANVKPITISGHNRFGLANHLYWLRNGKPGGHMIWNFLESPSVFREYTSALAAAGMSDSLVAQIRK